MANHQVVKIAIIGPESCGKSTLAQYLATRLNAQYVPEMARSYFAHHPHTNYSIEDVIAIAKLQYDTENSMSAHHPLLMCDTSPLVCRIWAEVRFGYCPAEITTLEMQSEYAHTLLCAPDIPWQADPLRESPHNREQLFTRYAHYLHLNAEPYHIIKGNGSARLDSALSILKNQGIGI